MKKIVSVFLLATTLLPAQTAKKPCNCNKTIPETIPYTAVEPAFHNTEAYCPREEYELKWFVQESVVTDLSQNQSSYSNFSFTTKKVLVFKPMCVRKDESN